jgi:hypothetical protein
MDTAEPSSLLDRERTNRVSHWFGIAADSTLRTLSVHAIQSRVATDGWRGCSCHVAANLIHFDMKKGQRGAPFYHARCFYLQHCH